MTISAISGSSYSLPQLNQVSSPRQRNGVSGDGDGDNDGSRVSGAAGGTGGPGAFIAAIFQALSQTGVSGGTPAASATANQVPPDPSSATASNPPKDPLQALGAFMHALFAALENQGGQAAPGGQLASQGGGDGDGDNDGSANSSASSGVANASHGHHHHGGGLAKIESNLQTLIQQLSSGATGSSTIDTSGTASNTASPAAASSPNPTASLEQSYQNLLATLGVAGNSSTLGSFLQSFSQNLHGAGKSGNLVNTQA